MYQLKNNPILLPHQVKILKLFFSSLFGKDFFLTGGTALSAFYLAHRDSKDFDLFTLGKLDLVALDDTIRKIAQETGAAIIAKVRSETYHEIYLEKATEGWTQRLDFVKEIPLHFGEIREIEGVRIDSLENIASNKILAVFGRLEPKDYLDLYLILRDTSLKFDDLFELARRKDAGLFEFYFANIIIAVEKFQTLPEVKTPFDKKDMVKFYRDLSRQLLLKIKPKA